MTEQKSYRRSRTGKWPPAAVVQFLVLVLVLVLVTPRMVSSTAPPVPPPFLPGEKLDFVLRWEFVNAGAATLEVMPFSVVDGVPAYHFVMTARTNNVIDVFYKVRDRIDTYTDTDMDHSLLYKKRQREGGHKRDIVVRFDWEKEIARYTNFGKPKPPVKLMPGSFDPLSAFYYVRFLDMEPGKTITRPVTDGKKNVMGKVTVVRRETITVEAGTFDTFLIEPDIEHIGGVFEKSEDAKIEVWVTADHRKMPVRIRSKVVVGSFVGELVSCRPGIPPAVNEEQVNAAGKGTDIMEHP